MPKLLAAILLAFGLATTAAAADDPGPRVGAKAPDIGTPLNQAGKTRPLDSLMGEKGLVLVFFRSAGWCPFCQAQLIELNGGVAEMEKRGYRLAGLSYDQPAVLAAFATRRGLAYTLLSDPRSEIIDRFNLRDPQYGDGSKAKGVPRPIILVLSRDGTIEAKLFEETYKTRPPAGLVIETLDKVSAGRG